ncbi:hypothetical protein GQE99_20065 [Maritimibacter sp. DP07]|uniref:Uncharacterized protein n=1 Tax=Maritimibacter harenae TaxID=2606218 RepID=A0A845MC44_9RHOB|nr:hypothetical protein [Maritimibacter harenae]MZR15321.1 hypothetical protein [Maritimibacter harenae]
MTLALVAALVAPGPAAALSCIRTTPTDAFQRADESPDRYVVVHGRLDFDQSRAPEGYDEDASDVTLPARLSGQALNRDGFTTPFDVSLDLTLQCAGPWCGTIARDVDQLLFVKVLDRGYALEIGACPGNAFANPSQGDLDAMVECLGGACVVERE